MEYCATEEDALSHDGLDAPANELHASNDNPIDGDVPFSSQGSHNPSQNPSQCSHTPSQEVPVTGRQRSIGAVRSADSVTDARRYPLRLTRYWHPAGLLRVTPQHLRSIESQGKCFGMVAEADFPIYAGVTWSFVDYCPAGLTEQLQKVLYLFALLNSMANNFNLNKLAVPTEEIECTANVRLRLKYDPNKKNVLGVLLQEIVDRDEEAQAGAGRFGSVLLADDSADLQSGPKYTQLPFFEINLGFTAALFRVEGSDREEIAQFGVVSVTSLINVDSLRLILVSRCACAPLPGLTPLRRSGSWSTPRWGRPSSRRRRSGCGTCAGCWSTS